MEATPKPPARRGQQWRRADGRMVTILSAGECLARYRENGTRNEFLAVLDHQGRVLSDWTLVSD